MTPRRRIVPVFVPHLGCPNACVFCDQRTISGSLCPAGPEDVRRALEKAQAICDEAELAFYGGSFTAIPADEQRSLLAAAQPFRASGFLRSIRVSTRPDAVTPEILRFLKDYGVETVELGAQSTDDEVLRLSGRGHDSAVTAAAAGMVTAAGMALILQMMTGLPGADRERDILTGKRLAELRPDGVWIYPTVLLRGPALDRRGKEGKYKAHTVRDAVNECATLADAFLRAGIPILRMGLNPTEVLSAGKAVGGAYHPALGEMVYSRLYLEKAREAIRSQKPQPRKATLLVEENMVSRMTGLRGANLLILRWEFGLEEVRVKGGAFPPETVAIDAET